MDRPLTALNTASPGVTLTDSTGASIYEEIWRCTMPRGTSLVIPGTFNLMLEMLDAAAAECNALSKFCFAMRIPTEPTRQYYLGPEYHYRAFFDLTLAQQQSDEFKRSTLVEFGFPFLALGPEETLLLYINSATVCDPATAATHLSLQVPYFERKPSAIAEEKEFRRQWIAV